MTAPSTFFIPVVMSAVFLSGSAVPAEPSKDAALQDGALQDGARIVFFGDSITQAGDRPGGYVTLVREAVREKHAELEIEIVGAGVSGNRVPDLEARLDRDVLSRGPSLVVIYIGINDVWHTQRDRGTPKPEYEQGLRRIVRRIQDAGARVILCTPSVIGERHDGTNELDGLLAEYSAISRQVARETNARLLDLRKAFLAHLKDHNAENAEQGILTTDGVHLNERGNRFVAAQMLETLETPMNKPVFVEEIQAEKPLPDPALQPPRIITSPGKEFGKSNRGAQGVPGIERAAGGRLWAAWYTGKSPRGVESSTSYCVLATSGDGGHTWSDLKLVIQAPPPVHTYDPCLWIDPAGRLWYFWAQSVAMQDGRMGVWAITTDDPDEENPAWSAPRRIANGIMLNKPTVLKSGDWLLPVGLWPDHPGIPNITFSNEALKPYTREMLSHDLGDERASNVYRSTDQGETFELFGQARVPDTRHDEHMIVERRDGSLWMLLRNTRGMAQTVSTDGGRTWSEGSMFLTGGKVANKRFFLRRLQSGVILLVRNDAPTGSGRTHMTAFLSDDDGRTWTGGLLLDERESSYPDGVQAPDGTIHVIYDHQRYTLNRAGKEGVGGVLLATFTEEDVRAGKPASEKARLKVVISQLQ